MKKASLIFCFFSLIGWAQSSNPASLLLDEVAAKISSYDNIKFNFSYVLENQKEQIRQETNGKVIVEKEKYVLEIPEATQLFDGQKKYTILPENEEINITDATTDDDLGIDPNKLLYFYQEGYGLQMDIVQNVQGNRIQFIKLTPQDTDQGIQYLLLGIYLSSKHIYRIIEIGENGTRTTLTLQDFRPNNLLVRGTFVFDAANYPNYYINN